MRVGPDTSGPYGNFTALHFSGYWGGDNTVLGFSHLHLHGTGAAGTTATSAFFRFRRSTPPEQSTDAYKPTFKSADETADPGHCR